VTTTTTTTTTTTNRISQIKESKMNKHKCLVCSNSFPCDLSLCSEKESNSICEGCLIDSPGLEKLLDQFFPYDSREFARRVYRNGKDNRDFDTDGWESSARRYSGIRRSRL
jgi:hypothetical protein